MNRFKKISLNLLLLFAGCSVAIGLGEGLLRTFEPVTMRLQGNEIRLSVNERMVIKNDQYDKLDPLIIHSKNSIGFRGDEPPWDFDRALTILAVGGSTTEGYYLSDGMTWPEKLQDRLARRFPKVWVNNAGLDGHSTFGHLFLLKKFIADISPDVVVYMVGVNEMGLDKENFYDERILADANITKRLRNRSQLSMISRFRQGESLIVLLAEYSHLVNLALNISRSIKARQAGLGHEQVDFATGKAPRPRTPESQREALEKDRSSSLGLYGDRLRQLIDSTIALGIKTVLVTQPAYWGYVVEPATRRRDNRTSFHWNRLELYNDVTRRIGGEKSIFLIDLARRLPKSPRYYYDWFHFTNQGAVAVADIVSESMTPWLRDTFPEHR